MDQDNFTDLGIVTNLRIEESPSEPGTFSLFFRPANGEQQRLLFTESATRVLWHYLTQMLYPRAAGSLTSKAATAAISLATSMTAIFAVKVVDKGKQIEVIGVSTLNGWSFRLTREDAGELWRLLEDVLHNV